MQGQSRCRKFTKQISSVILLTSLLLSGCQTTDIEQFTGHIVDAFTPTETLEKRKQAADAENQQASDTASSSKQAETAPTSPPTGMEKSPLKWGLISLSIGAGGPFGDDWYLQVYPTGNTPNFIGVNGEMLSILHMHTVQLWPGDYTVRVIHNTVTKYDEVVTVNAGEMIRLTGVYGYFFNNVDVTRTVINDTTMLDFATRKSVLPDNFRPITVAQQNNWLFQFNGPQINGQVGGIGTITVLKSGSEVATISDASIGDDEITGTVKLADEGVYEGRFNRKTLEQVAGTKLKWKNGKTFEGTFDVVIPKLGKLTQPSGSFWEGEVKGDKPNGKGRYTNTDGSWVEYSDYAGRDNYVGLRDCGPSADVKTTCAYYKGEKLASEADLNNRIAEVQRQEEAEQQRLAEQQRARQIAAAQAAEEAAIAAEAQRKAAAELAAKQPVIPQKTDDCTTATGTFIADGDLTRYTMNGSGNGNGHFRQFTYGGTAQYQFDIDFRFSTTANSINFQYDQGIYRDASSGTVLQRTSIPGGSANCSFNGRVLTIDGKEFVKK